MITARTVRIRIARHYQKVLESADRLYQGGQVVEAVANFETAWPQIRDNFRWAQDNLEKDEEAVRICCLYPSARILHLRLKPLARGEWINTQLLAARALGDQRLQGLAYGELGVVHFAMGDSRNAIELYERSCEITRQFGDRRHESVLLNRIGTAYAELGDTRRAVEFHEHALQIARETGDRRSEGEILGKLGGTYHAIG